MIEAMDGQASPTGTTGETATPAAATASAATAQTSTAGGEGGTNEAGATEQQTQSKTFTQEELDDIVRRRVAKAEAKAERRVLRTLEQIMPRQSQQTQPQQQQVDTGRPTRSQGESDDAYFDRLTDWKLEQRDQRGAQQAQAQTARTLTEKTENIYAQAEKLPGFDREGFDELPLTKPMVEALIDSEHAPKLMHYMASHPEDVERIAKLSPARQAAELGKLEDKAASAPLAKPSKAPPPAGSVAGAGRTPGVVDLASADMDNYVKQRKAQGASWARH